MEPIIVNKGTGAGGANTTRNGKGFENKTNNESRLLSNGFIEKNIPKCKGKYIEHEQRGIIYLTQGGLKSYFKHFFNIDMCRHPDEAYLIRNGETYILKILEKKNQNTSGSVEDKLLTGYTIRFEYQECVGERFQVEYAYCLSEYLKNNYLSESIQKYKILRKFNTMHNITVLFGNDDDYYVKLDEWIGL